MCFFFKKLKAIFKELLFSTCPKYIIKVYQLLGLPALQLIAQQRIKDKLRNTKNKQSSSSSSLSLSLSSSSYKQEKLQFKKLKVVSSRKKSTNSINDNNLYKQDDQRNQISNESLQVKNKDGSSINIGRPPKQNST